MGIIDLLNYRKYEVYKVLGMGGFGIVYLVSSHKTGSVFAMKTLRNEYDLQTEERFKKEAQVWIDLGKHPYLVQAYFVENIIGKLFIAMEYIAPDEQGLNSLEGYLRHSPPDLAQSLRWAIQFCQGMEYAYSKGIRAHRDIKPANIMIGQDKAVKISDFGLAGVVSTTKSSSDVKLTVTRNASEEVYQTMRGTALGTPPYMPPEQFENAAGCDERSDIYSFGIVLYQTASGNKFPHDLNIFRNISEKEMMQAWYILHIKAPVIKLDSPLFPIIFRCLEKAPIDRYFTFKELRRDLEKLLKKQTGELIKLPEQKELEVWEWHNKGISLVRLGKPQEAIACFDKAIEINPVYAKTWVSKADAFNRLGKLQEAIACYDKAIEIDPRYAYAWYNKGDALYRLDKLQEAIACYDKAIEIDPAYYAFVWLGKGILLSRLGKPQEAIACYSKALEIEPKDFGILSDKGDALREIGEYQEAIACYSKALEINPEYPTAWYGKALVEDIMVKRMDAAYSYKKFIELAPTKYTEYKEEIEYARQRIKDLTEK
jgi:serine/threonine protein kinase